MVAARRGGGRLSRDGKVRVLPDAGFALVTPAGAIECYLEWDRGTETQTRLIEKVITYRRAERRLYGEADERSILFVVPGERRLQTLRHSYTEVAGDERLAPASPADTSTGWQLLATTVSRLHAEGPLGAIWESVGAGSAGSIALAQLPRRRDLRPVALSETLGRRWRKESPDFWQRLSPLGTHARHSAEELEPSAASALDREGDLRLSGIDGSMDDPDDESLEERWL